MLDYDYDSAFDPDVQAIARGDAESALAGRLADNLGTLFSGWGEEASNEVYRSLLAALGQGDHPSVAARNIERDLLTTIGGMTRNRAMVIARTEMLGSYRDTQLNNYRANSDVVQQWMWSAADGACPVCSDLDGETFDLDESQGSHPCCRCACLPVTRSYDDILSGFGIDTSEMDLPDDTSILNSYVPMRDRFAELSAAEQDAILGKAAGALYRNGDLSLDDLVGRTEDGQYYQKSLKELGYTRDDLQAALNQDAYNAMQASESAAGATQTAEQAASDAAAAAVAAVQDTAASASEAAEAAGLSADALGDAIDSGALQAFGDTYNDTYQATIDGEDYFVKLLADTPGENFAGLNALEQGQNELIADQMLHVMGLDAYSVDGLQLLTVDGRSYLVEPWLGETTTLAEMPDVVAALGTLPQEDLQQLLLGQYLIGDVDRNPGNYLQLADGRWLAIDHGFAFSTETLIHDDALFRALPRSTPISRDAAEALLSHRDEMLSVASALTDAQREALAQRLDLLQRFLDAGGGNFDDFDWFIYKNP